MKNHTFLKENNFTTVIDILSFDKSKTSNDFKQINYLRRIVRMKEETRLPGRHPKPRPLRRSISTFPFYTKIPSYQVTN